MEQKNRAQLYTKLLKAKRNINPVKKDGLNPHFKSGYPTLNSMIEAVEPALMDEGLLLTQPIQDGEQATFITDVETGEFVSSFMKLPELDNPQKVKSCSTYYRRTTLSGLLGLRETDDDGNDAIPKRKPTLEPERFTNALKSIKNEDYTTDQLLTLYDLTETQKRQLNTIDF
jgi:hypothetical protein